MRNPTQHPVDMMTFPFTGVAGYLTWYGMQEGLEFLWPATIRVQQHMNGDDVITISTPNGDLVEEKKIQKGLNKIQYNTIPFISKRSLHYLF